MTQPPPSQGRDPRQPFGTPDGTNRPAQAPAGHSSQARQQPWQHPSVPPPRRPRWWIPLLGLLVLGLLGWAAVRLSQDPATPETPVATREASFQPTSAPATTATIRTTVPFENGTDHTTGTFEVLDHSWDVQGLTVKLRVHLDGGTQPLRFFALDNARATDHSPSSSGSDYLQGQSISAGQTLTGTVLFVKPRGDTTIFLADSTGRQVTALVVKG